MKSILLPFLFTLGTTGCDFRISACTEDDPACERPGDDEYRSDGGLPDAGPDADGGRRADAGPVDSGGPDDDSHLDGDYCNPQTSSFCALGYRCDEGSLTCNWALGAPPQAPEDCGTRLYVDADSEAVEPDGRGWHNALPTLTQALHVALARRASCDVATEIWVAEGRYTPTGDGDRHARFLLHNQLQLYGGFAGHEARIGERDPVAHPTILSGDLNGDDDQGERDDNSRHILVGTAEDAWPQDPEVEAFWGRFPHADLTTIVDGFTLSGGHADYAEGKYDSAPAMRLRGRSITARNLVVTGNHAHSGSCAIAAGHGSVLEHVRISNNGAIQGSVSGPLSFTGYDSPDAVATLRHTVIVDNAGPNAVAHDMTLRVSFEDSYLGGAVTSHKAEISARRSVFTGAIEVSDRSSIQVVDSVFTPHGPDGPGRILQATGHVEASLGNCIIAGGDSSHPRLSLSGWSNLQANHVTATTARAARFISLLSDSSATIRNSIVYGSFLEHDLDEDSSLAVESSCTPRSLGEAAVQCSDGPMFRGPLANGTWSSAVYDPADAQTSLMDSAASFVPGALKGLFLEVATEDGRWLQIVDNTDNRILVWGNQLQALTAGSAYTIHDLRLHGSSIAVDGADDATALSTDMHGQGRVDLVGAGASGAQADLGALELTEAVRASCQVNCP